jgi:hypothetical protein
MKKIGIILEISSKIWQNNNMRQYSAKNRQNNPFSATGNRQQATGNRQQATGNRQQATGNRQHLYYTSIHKIPCQLYISLFSNNLSKFSFFWKFFPVFNYRRFHIKGSIN